MTEVDRRRVLGYRAAAQELHRPGGRAADLAVAGLGVQDTPYGSARLALAARGVPPEDDRLELVWSMRGAPHLHRRPDLPALATALWPLSVSDRVPPELTYDCGPCAARHISGSLFQQAGPFLAARDRGVLVPEKAHQAQVWRIIGNPGAVLVDGDVAGTWRARQAGRKTLEITVTPFAGRLSARVRGQLDAEAALVAGARGAAEARVAVAAT
ncbi:crosslink repair DNA glycosylase YcaQ family protein [Micromonospora sp. NPDC047707]|uniref:DNA glycosylase AlkZ-like family protein n=1 Tax=Micromonospora sp. NPDC047707 TaxID=3154498 RepID=UPI003455A18B